MPVPQRSTSLAAPPRRTSLPRQPQQPWPTGSSALQVRGAVALAPVADPLPLPTRPAARASARGQLAGSQPIARSTARSAARPAAKPAATVTRISQRQAQRSQGLRLLIAAQRTSLLGASVITTVALVLYGWTVYTQQQWSKQYSQFRTLQRHEQQLITATGALEAQLLQQPADGATTGLQVVTPQAVVELSPAPARPLPPVTPPVPQTQMVPRPIGY